MKVCAYCKKENTLTREHIWPTSIIKKQFSDELKSTYNPKNNRFYPGEPVIKDVCAECNNEKLSNIDRDLALLYDEHFHDIVQPGDSVFFEYNYENLLRGLLKISFNSARAQKNKNIIWPTNNLLNIYWMAEIKKMSCCAFKSSPQRKNVIL
ncbi:hypothetical protein GMJAKD_02610 [Candidatus Electrothrix aarhusensis]